MRQTFLTAHIFPCYFILACILWAGILPVSVLQSQVYVDDNAVYVDAPSINNQNGPNGNEPVQKSSKKYYEQLSMGQFNYGYIESVYSQFSGNSIFEGGNSPTALFTNITWNHIIPLEFKYIPGISVGGDFLHFNSNSESVYNGSDDVVTGPSIDMLLYMSSFMVKAFFMDPFDEFLQPYFSVGWGIIFGEFDSTKVGGDKSSSSFTGGITHRSIGIQIKLSDQAGMIMETRTQTARARTSNDPFNQSSGSTVDLVFDGIMIGLSGFYRF